MAGRFRPEDTVRRGEGGPIMGVKGYDRQGRVICSWYETGKGWQQKPFDERALRVVRRARGRVRPQ